MCSARYRSVDARILIQDTPPFLGLGFAGARSSELAPHAEWSRSPPPRPAGADGLIYHLGSICSLVKYHPREQTQCGHLTFLDERWRLCSPPGMKQIRRGDVRQRTFQRGHQMGAGVMTLGLRAAVGTDRRLQVNKPDPVVPIGPHISSTAAGANSENEVSLADAGGARWASAAVAQLPRCGLPLVPSQGQLAPVGQKAQLAGPSG